MITVITTIVSTLFGGGIVALATFLVNRKSIKRKGAAEAEAAEAAVRNEEWQQLKDQFAQLDAQLDRMNEQIEFKDKRIMALNEEVDYKEKRYIEQTVRLREVQDREYRAQQTVIELTQKVGELELIIERHKCIKERCPFKEPATELTRKIRAMLGLNPDVDELPTEDPQPELSTKHGVMSLSEKREEQ